jgi:hypothetical protein
MAAIPQKHRKTVDFYRHYSYEGRNDVSLAEDAGRWWRVARFSVIFAMSEHKSYPSGGKIK